MAAGDVSKQQATLIREFLGDDAYKLIPNDSLIYDKLSYYQQEWMICKLTTIQTYSISLVSGTVSYALNPRLFQILDVFVDPATGNMDIAGRYDERTHALVITSDFANNDVIYVKGYIKPAYITDDRGNTYDVIDETQDPLIGYEYYNLLRQAVMSDYSQFVKGLKSIEDIENKVSKIASELREKAMFNPGSSPINLIMS